MVRGMEGDECKAHPATLKEDRVREHSRSIAACKDDDARECEESSIEHRS